jgi:hypothetical protein
MEKPQFLEYVEGLGKIYVNSNPLDEQLKAFREQGIKHPISIRDTAYLRLNRKHNQGTRTCHAPIYADKKAPVIIARVSPLVTNLRNTKRAVQAHLKNQYPVFDKEVYEKWEAIAKQEQNLEPEKRKAIFLSQRGDYQINKNSDEAKFFFKDIREDYFNLIKRDKINIWNIDPKTIDSQDEAIINYLWFPSVAYGSELNLRDRNLDYDDRAFGVLQPAKQAQKISEGSYIPNLRELEQALKITREVKQGSRKNSELEIIIKLLEKF